MLGKKLFPNLPGKWLEQAINIGAEYDKTPAATLSENPALDPAWCGERLAEFHKAMGVDYSYGGWMDDRTKLWRGHYFSPNTPIIHLGVDYWVPEGSWVCLPKPGRLVLVEQDPDTNGGWGGRAIYQIGNLWVIFAHLHKMPGVVDEDYDEGAYVGRVAPVEKSGGWFPHLHVQCCVAYNSTVDGYRASRQEEEFPDPEKVLL